MISHPRDVHATRVTELLRREQHEVLLLDLSELPGAATLSLDYQASPSPRLELAVRGQRFDLRRARAAWWRRPQAPDLSSITDADVHAFTHNEWHEAVHGLWQLMEARWMNPPARDDVASRKAFQLRVAADVGLRIPRTLITSDASAARKFVAAEGLGRVIFKTFSCTHAHWRETRLVREEELGHLDSLKWAPVIFQEYLAGGVDLRVTIVGNEVYAAAIHASDTPYPVDFRMSLGRARTEPIRLPVDVEEHLLILMERLGLVYGAVDLRRLPSGEHVFLEVNTAGEFLFVEERAGLPISRAIADWLSGPS